MNGNTKKLIDFNNQVLEKKLRRNSGYIPENSYAAVYS